MPVEKLESETLSAKVLVRSEVGREDLLYKWHLVH